LTRCLSPRASLACSCRRQRSTRCCCSSATTPTARCAVAPCDAGPRVSHAYVCARMCVRARTCCFYRGLTHRPTSHVPVQGPVGHDGGGLPRAPRALRVCVQLAFRALQLAHPRQDSRRRGHARGVRRAHLSCGRVVRTRGVASWGGSLAPGHPPTPPPANAPHSVCRPCVVAAMADGRYEREVWDLFGVFFTNHPVRRQSCLTHRVVSRSLVLCASELAAHVWW
jgi:hypothetical protein